MKLQYRIFQVGYNGSFHCPFMLGNVQDKEEKPKTAKTCHFSGF
jgi:hypothetical protein